MVPDSSEVVNVLIKRWELMEYLLEGQQNRCELHEEVGSSRSTVYRGLEQLAEFGLARESNGSYEVTDLGIAIAREYDQLMDRIEDIITVGTSLTDVVDEMALHPQLLADAQITIAKRTEPNAPVDEMVDTLRGAREVVGFTPVLDRQLATAIETEARGHEFQASLVIEQETLDHLQSGSRPTFEFLSDVENVSFYATDRSLPFGLLDVRTPSPEVCVSFYGPVGELRGVTRNDTAQSLEWARRTYRTIREITEECPKSGRA